MKAIAFLTILFLSTATSAASDANKYIKRMINQYSQLTEYEDEGTSIDIKTTDGGDEIKETISFATKYKRNKEFKLTWLEHPDALEKQLGMKAREYVFWRDGSGIYTKYFYDDKLIIHSNIISALSSVFGVFNESADFVPRFLTANSSCKPSLGAKEASIVKSTDKETIIKLITPGINDRYITINKSTNLLSKYEYLLSKDTKIKRVINYNVLRAK